MKKIEIRFSSNKIKRLIFKLKKIIDKLNKHFVFDIFTSKRASYLRMDKPLQYNMPSYQTDNSFSIPFILYKTGEPEEKDLSPEIKNLFNSIKQENPGLEIHYFSDKKRLDFIKSHFNGSVVRAYESLKPGAYRADLFRYCILFTNGGIYGDLTQSYMVPLTQIVNFSKDKLVLVKDYLHKKQTTNGICNAFIASQKKNPIFLHAIERIVNNVKNNNKGISSLDVTGPYLFRRALQDYQGEYKLELELNPFNHKAIRNIRTGKNLISTKLPNHDKLIMKDKSTDYHELWLKNDIFI